MVKLFKKRVPPTPVKGGAFSDIALEDKPARKIIPNPTPPPAFVSNKSTRERLLKFVNLQI